MNAARHKAPPEAERVETAQLGAMMREMRENLGRELDEVADDLRIRMVYLEAIEAGRLSDLPGTAYASGFLRAYSNYLGLDGDDIVRQFKMAGVPMDRNTRLHLPSPVEEGRLPTGSILLLALLLGVAAYGGWYYLSSQGRDPMTVVAGLPTELSKLVDGNGTAASGARSEPAGAPAATTAARAATETPAATGAPETSAAAPATAPQTGAGDPAPQAAAGDPAPQATAGDPAPQDAAGDSGSAAPASPATAAPTGDAENPADASAAPSAAPSVVAPSVAVTPEPATPEPAAPGPAPAAAPQAAPEPVPGSARPEATPPQTAAVPRTAEPPPETTIVAPAAEPPATGSTAPASTAPERSVAARSDPATPSAGAGTAAAGPLRIVVRATADTFVAVRTGDNEPLFSQLMRPGDTYEVPSGANLFLETGNAGGLQISVGGRRAPSLGPAGAIRRNIPLDADRLMRGLP